MVGSLGVVGRGGAGDAVSAFSNGARAEGGSGTDGVHAGIGGDWVTSADALALLGGSGDDPLNNLVGSPSIDCGSGRDTGSPNGATNVRRCEVAP